ncbi:MAG: DNA-directed RNA polymerase subunit omega [Firmicutes bacterium]|nr:DNA-directed RNA polymerase subunit omega [Bacillota bacterium]MDY5586159.1 DNA-directed RNA polymerase subunit omega [Eubacteriales bacterium]
MMIEPPIDELVKRTGGNKYKLSVIMAKRAKELEKRIPAEIEKSDKKAISLAADEIYSGKIVADS